MSEDLKTDYNVNIGDVTLRVNVTGLDIVADIPSLGDELGAYRLLTRKEHEEGMWFYKVPHLLKDIANDGVLLFDDLLDTNSRVALACINVTRTAACLQSIPSHLITALQ